MLGQEIIDFPQDIGSQSTYCFKSRFPLSFLLPKPGFASMESPEGTEDTPEKPQDVVGGGNTRPRLCPEEPEAFPAFSSFLGLSTAQFHFQQLTNLHQEPWMGYKDLGQGLWSRKEQGFSVSVMDFRGSTSAYSFCVLFRY